MVTGFLWRRVWDSNPRALADNRISSAARYDHFDNSPSMFSRRFSPPFSDRKGLWKELTERTANLFNFRTVENPHGYKVFGGRNGQRPARFRVVLVTTTSIRLHGNGSGLYYTKCTNKIQPEIALPINLKAGRH